MKISRQGQADLIGYAFILPNILGFMAFTIIPILFSLGISFTEWDYTQGFSSIHFTGLKNYFDLWSDTWFTDSLRNTFVFSFTVVPGIIVFSLILSVLIDQYVKNKSTIRLAMLLPYISNIVAVSIVWVMMYAPFGPFTLFLQGLGLKNLPQWLGDYNWALPAVILMTIWGGIGYAVMIYSAAIQGLPKELYEAATIDGAGDGKKFLLITVPLLSPTTFFLSITNFINCFQVFGQILVMTRGGPGTSTHTLSYYIYTAAFTFYKMGYAAAVSWILFLILLAITLVQWQGQKKWVHT